MLRFFGPSDHKVSLTSEAIGRTIRTHNFIADIVDGTEPYLSDISIERTLEFAEVDSELFQNMLDGRWQLARLLALHDLLTSQLRPGPIEVAECGHGGLIHAAYSIAARGDNVTMIEKRKEANDFATDTIDMAVPRHIAMKMIMKLAGEIDPSYVADVVYWNMPYIRTDKNDGQTLDADIFHELTKYVRPPSKNRSGGYAVILTDLYHHKIDEYSAGSKLRIIYKENYPGMVFPSVTPEEPLALVILEHI